MQPLHAPLYPRSMVFAQETIPVGASRHLIDGDVAAHRHMFVEIAVILGGSGQHRSEQGRAEAGSGDVFVIRPGTWHAFEGCRQCLIYNCYFGAELLQQELAWLHDDPGVAQLYPHQPKSGVAQPSAIAQLPGALCVQYRQLLDQMIAANQRLRPQQRAMFIGFLAAALGMLAQSLPAVDTAPAAQTERMHAALEAGIQMLEQRLDHPWTLAELAYQLHIDRSYLVRLWKQQTGYSPMAFLAKRRAECAAELLRSTAQSIGEIGYAVGWDDPNRFNRRFKAVYGVSAGTFRARARVESNERSGNERE